MKTKLILIIEVEEQLADTEKLAQKMIDGNELKVKDILNPEQIIAITEFSNIEAVQDRLTLSQFVKGKSTLPEPKPTKVNCIMMTRGV